MAAARHFCTAVACGAHLTEYARLFPRNFRRSGVFFNFPDGLYCAFWDWVSPMGDGFNALFLMLVGAACGILINTLMRNNLFTALLLGGCAHLLYVCLYTVLFVVAEGVGSAGWLFVRFYLPSVLYSLVFLPVFYLLVRAVMRRARLRRYQ